jgi:hypothetical protein
VSKDILCDIYGKRDVVDGKLEEFGWVVGDVFEGFDGLVSGGHIGMESVNTSSRYGPQLSQLILIADAVHA